MKTQQSINSENELFTLILFHLRMNGGVIFYHEMALISQSSLRHNIIICLFDLNYTVQPSDLKLWHNITHSTAGFSNF